MKERVDTFQVGPATAGGIQGLVQAKVATVLAEARRTANGRTITVRAKYTIEDDAHKTPPDKTHIAHIYIEHDNDPESSFNLEKERTVGTETWKVGVYSSPVLNS